VSAGAITRAEADPRRAHARRPERPEIWLRRIDLGDVRAVESVARTHLTAAETRRADQGVPAVRNRRVLLRAGLRQFLGELLDVAPPQVPLLEDDGRPHLPGSLGELGISCSASGRVGLVAVAPGRPVGVDVELHRDDLAGAAAAEGWLCPAEERLLGRLTPSVRPHAVTRCWTQKEAVLKGLGLGLRRHPRTVRTPVAEHGRIETWWLLPVAVAPGHVASAAVGTTADDVDLFVEDMTVGDS
jgi:4'-phosphopantetheinyl transferase